MRRLVLANRTILALWLTRALGKFPEGTLSARGVCAVPDFTILGHVSPQGARLTFYMIVVTVLSGRALVLEDA